MQQTACLPNSCSGHGTCVTQLDGSGGPLPNLCICDAGYRGATCFDCAAGFGRGLAGGTCDPLPPPARIVVSGADQSVEYAKFVVLDQEPLGSGTFDVHITWSIESGPGFARPS